MTGRIRNTGAARTILMLLLAAALGLAAAGAAFAQPNVPHDPAICLEYNDNGMCIEFGPNPAHPDHQS